jgi:hypothetical protein
VTGGELFSRSLKLDTMADTQSERLSFLRRETEFVVLGLDLVFHGMLAFVVTGDFAYLLDI